MNQRLNRAFCKLKVLVDEPSEFVNSRRDTEKSEFLVFGEKPINSQSFDNFLEFKENKFALQVLMKLKQRGTICHLLLFGPSGNGKSHLCSAVYSACKSVGTTALMLHSNNFVAWFVQSAYKNSIQSMREKIFSFDLLILEDLDFLEGKEKSQKELAYILDYFLLNSKSVLITSQRNPFFKTFLIGELQSKLEAFIPCEIKSPSEESRLLILSKLTKGKVPLSCLKPIAEKLTGSFRQMVAVSQNIEIYSSLFRQNQLTELEISSILSRFCPVESECEYKFDSLLEALEKIYCISKDKILSPNKNQKAVKARGVLIVILRDYFKLSFCEISKILGLKDHSSSLKSYNKIKESRDFWKIKQDLRECLNYFCERSGQKF
ncbi:MAG: DnaA/Hda family protein [Deltaproteobacteria bacterium]|nr:DnaA/Hda family protein [Deltaproteobacteria bacterium]